MELNEAERMFPQGTTVKCARSGQTFTVECYRRENRYDTENVIGTSPENHYIGYLCWHGMMATFADGLERSSGLRRTNRFAW